MLTQSQVVDLINQITLSLAPYGGINTIMCIIIAIVVLIIGSYLVVSESIGKADKVE